LQAKLTEGMHMFSSGGGPPRTHPSPPMASASGPRWRLCPEILVFPNDNL